MIGKALRIVRKFNDESLSDLAKRSNKPVGYLSELETEKRRMNLETLKLYANAYSVRASAILRFSEYLEESSKEKPLTNREILNLYKVCIF